MLDIKLIRQNPNKVKRGIQSKGCDPNLIDRILELDEKLRKKKGERELENQFKNKISKKIGIDKEINKLMNKLKGICIH